MLTKYTALQISIVTCILLAGGVLVVLQQTPPPPAPQQVLAETDQRGNGSDLPNTQDTQQPNQPSLTSVSFSDTFDTDQIVEETGAPEESTSPFWWVNSGALFIQKNGIGMTLHGDLPDDSPWKEKFATNKPEDTDSGLHPQNIFRLLTRNTWKNFSGHVRFLINGVHMSPSTHRSESNGILLFGRYQNEDNLYYAGLRVDGAAVIKKKLNGKYYTLAYEQVFPNERPYDPLANPNILPPMTWIDLRFTVRTESDSAVSLLLEMRPDGSTEWKRVAEARDANRDELDAPILSRGYAGIRTDFLDVSFDDFSISTL